MLFVVDVIACAAGARTASGFGQSLDVSPMSLMLPFDWPESSGVMAVVPQVRTSLATLRVSTGVWAPLFTGRVDFVTRSCCLPERAATPEPFAACN